MVVTGDAGACCREGSIAEARQQVQQQLGGEGLSLLVNNAGVGLVAPVEFVPLQEWRRVLDVNLQGPLAVTQVWRMPGGCSAAQPEPRPPHLQQTSTVACGSERQWTSPPELLHRLTQS